MILAREMCRSTGPLSLVTHFVDNDGISDAVIRGYSDVVAIRRMLMIYLRQETERRYSSWVSSVASPSNPADGPSRLEGVPSAGVSRGQDRSVEASKVLLSLTLV